mgnify:CR=1 FL=1
MKIADLSPSIIAQIKRIRWDRIIEKHEGPENWESVFRYSQPEFLEVAGKWILLPVDQSHHPNITILRCIISTDEKALTLFLQDTTYDEDPFFSGYMAVCEKVQGNNFFLATLFHEWFIIEQPAGILA